MKHIAHRLVGVERREHDHVGRIVLLAEPADHLKARDGL
jgi:hypothetical protein